MLGIGCGLQWRGSGDTEEGNRKVVVHERETVVVVQGVEDGGTSSWRR